MTLPGFEHREHTVRSFQGNAGQAVEIRCIRFRPVSSEGMLCVETNLQRVYFIYIAICFMASTHEVYLLVECSVGQLVFMTGAETTLLVGGRVQCIPYDGPV